MKDNFAANKALFILLIIFVVRFSFSGGGSVLYDSSSLIFKIEVLFILLYTLINLKLPGRTAISDPFVLSGLFAWSAVFLVWYAIDVDKRGFGGALPYLYKAFHAVFFIYVVDIIHKMRVYEDAGGKLLFVTRQNQENIMLGLLCLLTFSIALSSGGSSFTNAGIVLKHELIFVYAYVFIFKSAPVPLKFFKLHPAVSLLLISWFSIVTISFLFSPYELITKDLGVHRYHQTFFHAAFFVFVYQFFVDINKSHDSVMLMLPLSVAVLAAVFLVSGIDLEVIYGTEWFSDPPLNSHIRHTGYIATAATAVATTFMLQHGKVDKRLALYFLLLLASSTLLFWTGGRAAALSSIGVLILLVAYLFYARSLKLKQLVFTVGALFLAVYLSEVFRLFDWNGLIGQLSRTTASTENIDALMSSRPSVWVSVLESLKNHWIFGLGPQGYFFMPNRVIGVQPHNMFLQFTIEWGLAGAGLFIVLLLYAAINILGSIKNRASVATTGFLSSVAVLAGLTIHGLVDGTYYHGQPSYYIALALATCLAAISANRHLQVAR